MTTKDHSPAWRILISLAVLSATTLSVQAGNVPVPNASFELPVTESVDIRIDSWQEPPKPDWYDESGGFLWDQLTGLFKNTPVGSDDHIVNCDGAQAIYLFAAPAVGLFQDYDSKDWNDPEPTHAFDATFEIGKSYHLTVGVIASGLEKGMHEGASMMIGLYYRDPAGLPVTVAARDLVYTASAFPGVTNLIDFTVDLPAVKAGDAQAGKHIGIQMFSTVFTQDLAGGYWDLDNVRLTSIREPSLTAVELKDGKFSLTIESEPGLQIEVLSSPDLARPLGEWTSVKTLVNETGSVAVEDAAPNPAGAFYVTRRSL